MNIFCFGFGQVAKSFVRKIVSEDIDVNLNVTTRKDSQKMQIDQLNYNNFRLSENNFDTEIVDKLKNSDYVLVSISPINGKDIVIENCKKFFENNKIKWLTYLSATSVYGNHNGKWVDEESDTVPTSLNGIERLDAEKSWIDLANKYKIPTQIFRLSGIYSNERNILSRLKSGDSNIINKKNQFFSRIHVEDISSILFKSISKFKTNEIYNISDDKPSSSEEVALYGSKLLGIEKPKTVELEAIKSDMLRNFYKDSKKVSNKKMKVYFNYELKYPSYKEGLNYIRNNFI